MKEKRMFGTMEAVFDLAYLMSASCLAIYFLATSQLEGHLLFGLMTLVLVVGDGFHLVPRVLSIVTHDEATYHEVLGIGKMVTSIGMTIFYLFLWQIGIRASGHPNVIIWTAVLYLLAAVRIGLCLLPRNRWRTDGCSERWNLIRNLPFLGMGAIVATFYFLDRNSNGFPHMWIAILLSFGFYLPVVLFAKKKPKIGMLMLPKTCMYIWIITMGIITL